MIGSPLINRGLQGKSGSCAGFYREDEWVNREMAYELATRQETNRVAFQWKERKRKIRNNGVEDIFRSVRYEKVVSFSSGSLYEKWYKNIEIFLKSAIDKSNLRTREIVKIVSRLLCYIYANVIATRLA